MQVQLTRKLFPFLPADPVLKITKLGILFETEEPCAAECPEIEGCPCAHADLRDSHLLEVTVDHANDDCGCDDEDELEITCVTSADWPKLYHGVAEVDIGPIDSCHKHRSLTLSVNRHARKMTRAFMLCRYEAACECCATMPQAKEESHAC